MAAAETLNTTAERPADVAETLNTTPSEYIVVKYGRGNSKYVPETDDGGLGNVEYDRGKQWWTETEIQ